MFCALDDAQGRTQGGGEAPLVPEKFRVSSIKLRDLHFLKSVFLKLFAM